MTKKTRWGLVGGALFVVLGLGWFLWHVRQTPSQSQFGGFGGGGPGGPGGGPPGAGGPGAGRFGLGSGMAVTVGTAVKGDIPVRLAALGTVTPLASVTVLTQISGQLQQVAFEEGQMVKKGQFLAQIDPRPYENTKAQTEGVLMRDQAQLANARLDLTRYQNLVTQSLLSKQQLDTQSSLVQQLMGTVATDMAQANAARLNLEYTRIVSPINGRVGLRQVDVGNYVTPGTASGLVVITQLEPISTIFPVPEDNVPELMKRVRSGASLEVKAYDRSNTTLLATGKLVTVDNLMDTTTGTVKLRAVFDNKDDKLFPNQFVNIQLLVDTLHDQIVIPTAAVQHGAVAGVPSTFVFVVGADSTVSVRQVSLGITDGDHVAITKGVEAGETVVTEGGDRLREGAKVQLPGAAPATQPRAGGTGTRRNGANGAGNRNNRNGGAGGAGANGGGGNGGAGGGANRGGQGAGG